MPLMHRLLRVPENARVLEVGCGTGNALAALWRCFAPRSLTGVDIDTQVVAIARQRVATQDVPVRVALGDLEALPWADGTFDLVVDFGTSYHVADRESALREIERVLAPGGLWIHETRLAQLISHPRTAGRTPLPLHTARLLTPHRNALLWAAHRRACACEAFAAEARLRSAST